MAKIVATQWAFTAGQFNAILNAVRRTLELGTLGDGAPKKIGDWRKYATAGDSVHRFVSRGAHGVSLDSNVWVDESQNGRLTERSIASLLLETVAWMSANWPEVVEDDDPHFTLEDVDSISDWLSEVIEQNR